MEDLEQGLNQKGLVAAEHQKNGGHSLKVLVQIVSGPQPDQGGCGDVLDQKHAGFQAFLDVNPVKLRATGPNPQQQRSR